MIQRLVTAESRGLVCCETCGLLSMAASLADRLECPRCTSTVHARKPDSLARSAAWLIAAAILYIPANLLPIMETTSLTYHGDDTILGGVVVLWKGGSWPLALLVFSVSILVPLLKFIALSLLIVSTHRGSSWRLHDRTVLYRLIEFVGRWSMLDIFVVALMVALVQLRGVATIHAGPGSLAFATVVVLMMKAAQAFDPRLMWDGAAR